MLAVTATALSLAACGGPEGQARVRARQLVSGAELSDIAAYKRPGRPDVACATLTQPALSDPPPPRRTIIPFGGGDIEFAPAPDAPEAQRATFEARWRTICRG